MSHGTMERLALGHGLPARQLFEAAQREGWVASRTLRATDGRVLRLYNYTKECQYQRRWNEVTLIARGLIIDDQTNQVEALPLEKFFNLGEQISETRVAEARDEPFDALIKMDGSLGIGYRDNGLRWATRGSFSSSQSAVAQTLWEEFRERALEAGKRDPNDVFMNEMFHITPLAEIIHPDTRVVVTYKFQGLVLLAARSRFTGEELNYAQLQQLADLTGMQLVERLPGTDTEALLERAKTLDGNEEGFVLWWPGAGGKPGERVKVKGMEYLRRHKLVTNIAPRDLAQYWLSGTTESLLVEAPEEHRLEYEAEFGEMDTALVAALERTEQAYKGAPSGDQREFARWAASQGAARATLFNRRNMESPDYGRRMARSTMAQLLDEGRLQPLLLQMCALPLARACQEFETAIGQYLWDVSRTAETRSPLGRLLPRFPKAPRSVLGVTMEMLQPELIVARLREFLAHPDQRATCGHLTVEEILANAPSPECRFDKHLKWVFSLPLPLRSILDRWRESGRRDTADKRARALLAVSIDNETTAEVESLLGQPLKGTRSVSDSLRGTVEVLSEVWSAIPLAEGPRAALAWARCHPSGWPLAMLNCAWSTYRNEVAKAYLDKSPPAEAARDDE